MILSISLIHPQSLALPIFPSVSISFTFPHCPTLSLAAPSFPSTPLLLSLSLSPSLSFPSLPLSLSLPFLHSPSLSLSPSFPSLPLPPTISLPLFHSLTFLHISLSLSNSLTNLWFPWRAMGIENTTAITLFYVILLL